MNGKLKPLDRLFELPCYNKHTHEGAENGYVSRVDVAAIIRDYELEVGDLATGVQLLQQYRGTLKFVDGTHAHRIEIVFMGMAPITGNDLRELFSVARQVFGDKAAEEQGGPR